MNRIDRLHAILTHLQSKKLVTAQEMADRFNISLRTVYRDVKALDESGVPVIGEAGTGYTIMEGYRLPPVMFSQEEASALMLGSKLAEKFTDGSVKKHFNAALFKIKAVLRTTDKEYVDNLTDHIESLAEGHLIWNQLPNAFLLLQQAVANRKVVRVSYHSSHKDETTQRDLEPFGLLYYASAWHLIAWCRMRSGYRDFRLSRMISANLRDEIFDGSSHPSIQDYLNQVRAEKELQEVVILVDKTIVKDLKEQKFLFGFVSEEDMGTRVSMKFLTSCLDYFGRWLLAYTDKVNIVSPAPLQIIMKDLCAQLHAHYRE